jgi:sensor histidine kinase regulating citrate/malate metabolism
MGMLHYGHHRVEEEKEDQDEAGQNAYEKKCDKGVSTRNNAMTEGSGKWMSKDAVECCKPKIYVYVCRSCRI